MSASEYAFHMSDLLPMEALAFEISRARSSMRPTDRIHAFSANRAFISSDHVMRRVMMEGS